VGDDGNPTCFVVMGFGEKTDFLTGRKLNLDKTYDNIIKPAVETAKLECIRADEEQESRLIDTAMYERLRDADLVIADLSTGNVNAFFELGVRYGLRKRATIVMAESEFRHPFDVKSIRFLSYKHFGAVIGFEDVLEARARLERLIRQVMAEPQTDSPVYTFLPWLEPPSKREDVAARTRTFEAATPAPEPGPQQALGPLRKAVRGAEIKGDWAQAKILLTTMRALAPDDTWVLQQLALATYKEGDAEHRDDPGQRRQALTEAVGVLEDLNPRISVDAETLGLWGAAHKRLADLEVQDDKVGTHVDEAVFALQKGFFLLNDYYNGINFAYMLTLRASREQGPLAIADFVEAQRVRRRVLEICQHHPLVEQPPTGEETRDERYWVLASAEEAAFGLGLAKDYETWKQRAIEARKAAATERDDKSWMRQTTDDQLKRLGNLMEKMPLAPDLSQRS
jgi:hypothetical protein